MRISLFIATASILLSLGVPTSSVASVASAGNSREGLTSVDDGPFTLQVASFKSSDRAQALQESLPNAWIQEVRQNGRVVYRVNYKRFTKRSEALRAQWDLEDLGHQSLVQRLFS